MENSNKIPRYKRTKFSEGWLDLDSPVCRTRDEILRRDLKISQTNGCKVFSGNLQDPYTGENIYFNRKTDTTTVQIDHIVALKNGDSTIAWKWNKN